VAPELTGYAAGAASPSIVTPAADIFSLGKSCQSLLAALCSSVFAHPLNLSRQSSKHLLTPLVPPPFPPTASSLNLAGQLHESLRYVSVVPLQTLRLLRLPPGNPAIKTQVPWSTSCFLSLLEGVTFAPGPIVSQLPAGALVYELLSGKQLFEVGSNLGNYQSKLASIHHMDLSACPPQLLGTLKAMLSTQPSARPNANAFSGAPYFQVRLHVRKRSAPRDRQAQQMAPSTDLSQKGDFDAVPQGATSLDRGSSEDRLRKAVLPSNS